MAEKEAQRGSRQSEDVAKAVGDIPPLQAKKPKVVFLCAAGEESSACGQKMFLQALERHGQKDRFTVDHIGLWHLRDGRESIADADYIVPMMNVDPELLRVTLGISDDRRRIINLGFGGVEDQTKADKYERLLEMLNAGGPQPPLKHEIRFEDAVELLAKNRGAVGRVKVVFVCAAGEESSYHCKKEYDRLVASAGLGGMFETDYTGYSQGESFTRALAGSDFAVPALKSAIEPIKAEIGKLKGPAPVLVDAGIHDINDQGDIDKYRLLFSMIAQRMLSKAEKR